MRRELISVLFLATTLMAGDFYSKAKKGWHYYEETPKENTQDKDTSYMRSIPLNNLDSLSADEFKQTFEKVRGIATMKPTKENMVVYRTMMKFSLDKSKTFAVNNKLMSFEDGGNEYDEIANGGFSNQANQEQKQKRDRERLQRGDVVFVSFVNHEAEIHAQKQISSNLSMKEQFGVDARTFATEDYPDIKEKLGISHDVENFVFYKKSGEWKRIRRGLIDAPTFVSDFLFYEEFKNSLDKDNQP